MSISGSPHWLDLYGSDCYEWQRATQDGRTLFYRPLGLVEFCFDADGRYYEGRADISMRLDLTIESKLSRQERQRHLTHLTLAWACLRARHIIASAKAPAWQDWMHRPAQITHEYCFLVKVPCDASNALEQAGKHICFLEDNHEEVNAKLFYTQSQNSARVLNADQALSKLFVLPPRKQHDGKEKLTCIFVAAHEIGDGLSVGRWVPDFTRLLNMTTTALEAELGAAIRPDTIKDILPKAQESLYPRITGSRARRRWFWLLTRIVRHVRKPLPAGFANPLLRNVKHSSSAVPPLWTDALNYDRAPINASAPVGTNMSAAATARLVATCKSAGVSIGAGCFALAAIIMMEFYERQEPHISPEARKPFITGFPLNPRPWLTGNPSTDSLMLAFSDGILLPFLPSSLDLDGRLRLLAKAAQRQLAVYQKRSPVRADHDGLQYMSSRGAGRMLAIQYLSSFERCELLLPVEKRKGSNPQGGYEMRPNLTRQTCGVSSTGRRAPLNADVVRSNVDFVATAEDIQPSVRPREGEFLIGIAGTDAGIGTFISVDDSSMDPELVNAWLHRFETILEIPETSATLAKL